MPSRVTGRLPRRTLIGVAASAAVTGGLGFWPTAVAHAQTPAPDIDWATFDDAVRDGMQTFELVGAAIAIVNADGIDHRNTYGVRDLTSGAPVTPDTHFLVGSTTKSMSSLLVATHVDDGALDWDQPVRDVWPDFQAPSDALTRELRVRDLFGMASGIGELASTVLHFGDLTAGELLRSLVNLPVDNPPNVQFFYNNTLYAAGGYLPALLNTTAAEDLETAYARLMAERVYHPVGMPGARIASDPRPVVSDYATGHAPDFVHRTAAEPYAPLGSYAPAGGTMANLNGMANYVAMQLRHGVAVAGNRVVSEANLAEYWKPHVDVPIAAALDPDAVSYGYGMGWMSVMYDGGIRLVWHNGAADGFSTYLGFFPEENIGIVLLTNVGPSPRGSNFAPYVLNLLLEARFGLNRGANAAVIAQYQDTAQQLDDLARQALPVNPTEVAPYLGHYEKGWSLAFDSDGSLRLLQSSRAIRVMAMPDGSYVMAGGFSAGLPLHLFRDENGVPWLDIPDVERVRWMVGPTDWSGPGSETGATPTANA
jgi:CubicO group peptidase (beta-lactamase class C family)